MNQSQLPTFASSFAAGTNIDILLQAADCEYEGALCRAPDEFDAERVIFILNNIDKVGYPFDSMFARLDKYQCESCGDFKVAQSF